MIIKPVVFYALLRPEPDGRLSISFPDLPKSLCNGDTREIAIERATSYLHLALKKRPAKPRSLQQLSWDAEVKVAIAVGWEVVAIPA